MTSGIQVRALVPFGVELVLDTRLELTPQQQAEFRSLFDEHDLLLIRGPVMSFEDQLRLCGLLGPVLMSDSGAVSNDSVIGLAGVELVFHSDYGYSPEPLQAISLHAIDVVDGETSTRFASGRAAYESLDPALQTRVADLAARQVFGIQLDTRNRLADLDPALPSTVHALAPPHPATGSRYLYAPEMMTDSVEGLDEAESEQIIAQLFDALYGPGRTLEHRWQTGDFVIWHNTRVTHARGDVSKVDRRTLQRVTLGTKGYLDLYPHLANYEWDTKGTMVEGSAFADE